MIAKFRIINIALILLILLIAGCKKVAEEKPQFKEEINLALSKVPPTQDEIINLKNGYQITSGMMIIIDERCRLNGLEGGDTGNGYGCISIV